MNKKNKKVVKKATVTRASQLAAVAGWTGATAVLIAYFLASFGVITANSFGFQILNLLGAIGILIIALRKHVSQSVVINIVWIIGAIATIIGLLINL